MASHCLNRSVSNEHADKVPEDDGVQSDSQDVNKPQLKPHCQGQNHWEYESCGYHAAEEQAHALPSRHQQECNER